MKRSTLSEILKNHTDFKDKNRFDLFTEMDMGKEFDNLNDKLYDLSDSFKYGSKVSIGAIALGVLAMVISSALLPVGIAFTALGGVSLAVCEVISRKPTEFKIFCNKFSKKGRLQNAKITLLEQIYVLTAVEEIFSTELSESKDMGLLLKSLVEKRQFIQESFGKLTKSFNDLKKIAKDQKYKDEVLELGMDYAKCINFVKNIEKNYMQALGDLEHKDTESKLASMTFEILQEKTPLTFEPLDSVQMKKSDEVEREI